MDLRQLEYAVAVAEHGGFTSAAAALHVSQPALSHGIRALEAQLGVELFARLGRSVAITDAGARVVAAARRVLAEVADLEVVAALAAGATVGTLVLAALPTLSVAPLAELVGRFRGEHPGVVVRVGEAENPGEVEDAVRSGRAELGLTDLTTGAAGLERIELHRQRTVAICPPGTPDPGESLTAAALASMPLVVTPEGTSMRRLLDRAVARAGGRTHTAVEVHNREAIIPLVLAGAGASLVPAEVADEAARRGAVVRPLQPGVTRRIGLIHRPGHLSPAAAAFVSVATGASGS
jgi:LysR family transcriptional regulator, carnitine catabolism transcriptional activator